VFYCGLTMQHAVERDGQVTQNYATYAVNLGRVGMTFDDAALREIVNTISSGRDCLLEIVDLNVEVRRQLFMLLRGYRYAC
jgi:fatty acid synthase subunit alpha